MCITQAVADRAAAGDLSSDIAVNSKDETGQLLGALRRMQQSLVDTVTVLRVNAQGVASAGAQIAAGNHDLSGRTEEQTSALEETAAAASSLNSQAQSLAQAVAVFKLSDFESMTQFQAASRAPATQAGGMVSSRMPGPAEKPVPQATAVTALCRPAAIAGTQQAAVAMKGSDWEAF